MSGAERFAHKYGGAATAVSVWAFWACVPGGARVTYTFPAFFSIEEPERRPARRQLSEAGGFKDRREGGDGVDAWRETYRYPEAGGSFLLCLRDRESHRLEPSVLSLE